MVDLSEFRCCVCNKLLGKVDALEVEIKCNKCKTICLWTNGAVKAVKIDFDYVNSHEKKIKGGRNGN